jgi:hypothetical protein
MKAHRPVSIFSRGTIAIAILLTACIINSCKRDSKSTSPLPSDVTQAKTWYESSYPSSVSTNGSLVTQGTGGNHDLSKFIKPDWQHATSYVSGNKNVMEIPVDLGSRFSLTVKIGSKALNKAYSRSSYLLISDGKSYQAYILTIIADSAYVGSDLSKLSHNTYRKQDADFSGLALYYSPKGDYLGGYAYRNGQVVTPTTTTQQTGGPKVQSVNNGNLKPNDMVVECTDWYQQAVALNPDGSTYAVVIPWQYMGTDCISYPSGGSGGTGGSGSGTGGSGGGSSSSPPPSMPPPCPPGTTSGIPTASPCVPPPSTVESIGTGKLRVDFMPLPGSSPCSITTAPVPCFTIKTDSLKKYFPCAVALIINKLAQIDVYSTLTQAFTTAKRPDLTWQDSNLAWNSYSPMGGNNAYALGQTMQDPASGIGQSMIITLNSNMLTNSSQLLIAAAAIHETLHAYINYNVNTAIDGLHNGYKTGDSWLYGLDTWIYLNGLPANYSSHLAMMTDYFDKSVSVLKSWDNGAHTDLEYASAMLYGLTTSDSSATATETASLQTAAAAIKTKYGITDAQLNTFNINNLTVTGSATGALGKLPTSGCTP